MRQLDHLAGAQRSERPAIYGASFPSGTVLAGFCQATAPLGWKRVSTYDDAALRIVGSATPSSGGTNGFSTVMAQTTVGNTTLTSAALPGHTHGGPIYNSAGNHATSVAGGSDPGEGVMDNTGTHTTDSGSGGGGSHNHGITMAMKYVDSLIAKKN